jgi:hypothetical protein
VNDEAGMVTAELAAALPAVALLLVLALSAVATVSDQVRCIDAARAVARAVARGDSDAAAVATGRRLAPDGAHIRVASADATVAVTVVGQSAPALRWLGDRAVPVGTAVAAREGDG